jgi:hypothetical protein
VYRHFGIHFVQLPLAGRTGSLHGQAMPAAAGIACRAGPNSRRCGLAVPSLPRAGRQTTGRKAAQAAVAGYAGSRGVHWELHFLAPANPTRGRRWEGIGGG